MDSNSSSRKRTRWIAAFSLFFSAFGLILYLIVIVFEVNISVGMPSFLFGIMAWILAVEVKSVGLSILAALVTFSFPIFITILHYAWLWF